MFYWTLIFWLCLFYRSLKEQLQNFWVVLKWAGPKIRHVFASKQCSLQLFVLIGPELVVTSPLYYDWTLLLIQPSWRDFDKICADLTFLHCFTTIVEIQSKIQRVTLVLYHAVLTASCNKTVCKIRIWKVKVGKFYLPMANSPPHRLI